MKAGFFDTSAVLPLFVHEPRTQDAQTAYDAVDSIFAWSWMRVEAEAGLLRRRANALVWREWRSWLRHVTWLDLEPTHLDALCSFNRGLALRAADAGHLYVLELALRAVPDMVLITFDGEMQKAAERLQMPVWASGP